MTPDEIDQHLHNAARNLGLKRPPDSWRTGTYLEDADDEVTIIFATPNSDDAR